MAKLQAATSGKSNRSKLRRAKRQGIQEAEELRAEEQSAEDKKIKVTEFITVSAIAFYVHRIGPNAVEGSRLDSDMNHQERLVEVDGRQVAAFAFDDFLVLFFDRLLDDLFEILVQIGVFFLLGHGLVVLRG